MKQTQFKIGDKVREIATGDEGIISGNEGEYCPQGTIYVDWKTGDFKDMNLYTKVSGIEVVPISEITFEQAMLTLLQLGYKVILEKI